MSKQELKPCKCGGEARYRATRSVHNTYHRYWVECGKSAGSWSHLHTEDAHGETPEEAIKAWDTRAGDKG
jgi:hypothetical protein